MKDIFFHLLLGQLVFCVVMAMIDHNDPEGQSSQGCQKHIYTGLESGKVLNYTFTQCDVDCMEGIAAVVWTGCNVTYYWDMVPISQLRYLNLRRNNITTVMLRNGTNLEFIDLSMNSIRVLESNSLGDQMRHLKFLNLSFNEISVIERFGVFDCQINLECIDLRNNRLSTLDAWFMNLPSLTYLNLSHNFISEINNTIGWQPHDSIPPVTIDVTYNNFTTIDVRMFLDFFKVRNMATLIALMALQSSFFKVRLEVHHNPFHCDCRMYEAKSYFEGMNFWAKLVYQSDNHLLCAEPANLQGMAIVNVPIEKLVCEVVPCPLGCSCLRKPHEESVTVDCSHLGLTALPPYSMIPKLTGNELLELNFSRNMIVELNNHSYLPSLRNLDLSHNKIQVLDYDFMRSMNNIQLLNLSYNFLNEVHVMLSEVSGPWRHLSQVSIEGNNLSCNCSNRFLDSSTWMRANRQLIANVNKLTCSRSNSLPELLFYQKPVINLTDICTNITLDDLKDRGVTVNVFQANPPDYVTPIIIGVTSGVVAVIIVILIIELLWKKKICSILTTNKFKALSSEQLEEKRYDAFICYSDADLKWVLNSLVLQLEDEKPSFTLYFHHRDFEVGDLIANNIAKGLEKSQIIILVISKKFIESQWCTFEFHSAVSRCVNHKDVTLLLVLLEDVSSCPMEPDFKLYLDTYTCLLVSDFWFWEKLRMFMPKTRVKRPKRTKLYREALASQQSSSSLCSSKLNTSQTDSTALWMSESTSYFEDSGSSQEDTGSQETHRINNGDQDLSPIVQSDKNSVPVYWKK